jgi:hypothetical protein
MTGNVRESIACAEIPPRRRNDITDVFQAIDPPNCPATDFHSSRLSYNADCETVTWVPSLYKHEHAGAKSEQEGPTGLRSDNGSADRTR